MFGLPQVLDLLQVLNATILLLLLLNKAYRVLYSQINMLYSAITYIKNKIFKHMLQ